MKARLIASLTFAGFAVGTAVWGSGSPIVRAIDIALAGTCIGFAVLRAIELNRAESPEGKS